MPSTFASDWIPQRLRHAGNRLLGAAITYRGPFTTWDEARASTSGYDEAAILRRVVDATQKVLRGEASYEQDGVAFHGSAPASHALSGLLLAAGRSGGRLSVLDFGGGLASHYLRWGPVLGRLPELHWAVAEQAGFVAEGNRIFAADPSVSFHESVARVPSCPNAILASSVLQYLPDPHAILRKLAGIGCDAIVLDRTLYGEDGRECIVAQHVPRHIGKASYPVWMLSREKVHRELLRNYVLVHEFEASDQPARLGARIARNSGSIWMRAT